MLEEEEVARVLKLKEKIAACTWGMEEAFRELEIIRLWLKVWQER
jgi:hypothetical protein